ncbi:MAG TPA: cytochrome P450 [Longilinea sp.]|nr:cytochrome P450 [Longilinea sp.]
MQTASKTAPRDLAEMLPVLECDLGGVWHVRGYAEARAILQANVVQAGFKSESVEMMPKAMARPVLFQDGKVHQDQRKQIARFFSPATIQGRYRPMMEKYVADVLAILRRDGQADLNRLAARLAIGVASEVVGLTDSPTDGLTSRLEGILHADLNVDRTPGGMVRFVGVQARMLEFWLRDVRPAIRSRQAQRKEDVISHLLDNGYGSSEIIAECITYGAAGMVTTQEFICAASWHLLRQPELRQKYLGGSDEERSRILYELLRLEPVVGHLYRRAVSEVTLTSVGQTVTIPAGALIDLDIVAINLDGRTAGADAGEIIPERALMKGVSGALMGFGFGPHRCAGEFIAIAETDLFLQQFLRLAGLRIVREPEMAMNDTIKGYEFRNFIVAVDR